MASSQPGKPGRRPQAALKTAAKARQTGRAMKGLVKVAATAAGAAKAKAKTAAKAGVAKAGAAKAGAAKNRTARPFAAKAGAATKKTATNPAPRKATFSTTAPAARKPSLRKTTAMPSIAKNSTAKNSIAKNSTAKNAVTPARVRPAPPEVPAIDHAAREKEIARQAGIDGVNRALDLLETLARIGPVPLAVLADTAGNGKTATADLLTALRARDFVIQDDTHGLWRIGARWAVLGNAATEQGALAATAMPCLAALGNATGENVYLRVRDGMECETVAIYQTDPGLRVYTDVGAKMPLHAGSGRLLLAHAPEAVQTQVLARRLQRYTPSTRIDPTWIAADLHRIRQRGFLITDSEVVAGTVSVCAPVRDASGQVVATLLIGAPSLRMRPPRPRGLMPAVVDAARKLSTALGWSAESPAHTPANGPIDTRKPSDIAAQAMPAAAMGAAIARPHSIFR